MLACLCLPFALVVDWERMVGRVSDSMSLERQSKLSVLGEIAHLPVRTPVGHGSASATDQARSAALRGEHRQPAHQPDALRGVGDMRVLAVTSAANREGKTSVVSQLAMSFTRATGKPLLLIDGDMRCPDIHNVFDVPLGAGLGQGAQRRVQLGGGHRHQLERSGASAARRPAGSQSAQAVGQRGVDVAAGDRFRPSIGYVSDRHPAGALGQRSVGAGQGGRRLAGVRDARRQPGRPDSARILDRLEAAGGHPVGLVLNGVPVKDYSYRWGDYSYVRS